MKYLLMCSALVLFTANPRTSNLSGIEFSHILTEEDYRFEEEDSEPGVTILNPHQEYKSSWYCFKEPLFELRCIDWAEEPKQDASVTIYENDFTFDFYHDSGEMKNGCSSQLEEWRKIIKEGEDICIYGAFLQYEETIDRNSEIIKIDDKYIIIVIYAIKTEQGVWSYFTDGRIPGTKPLENTPEDESTVDSDVDLETNEPIQDEY